jgi:hypothetical protein
MPSRLLHKTADASRERAFWLVATALVLGQLIAFWMLCSHQVRKAQVRDASMQVERIAMADCLRYVPNATLGTCASRVAPLDRDSGAVAAMGERQVPGSAADVVPINHVYR